MDPTKPEEDGGRFISVPRIHRALYPDLPLADAGECLLTVIAKAQALKEAAQSNQSSLVGLRPHPANFEAMSRILLHNPYHSACINAKKSSTVGLGFMDDSIPEVLDPLTNSDIAAVLLVVAEDFFCTGNGYLEVVRDGLGPDSKIVGLHPLPSNFINVYIEGDGNWHYEMVGVPGGFAGDNALMKFARFGDSQRFFAKQERTLEAGKTVSEVIHFINPTSLNKWYGLPNWMSAVTSIELMQALDQREFDFFINRGVPEFLLFITGAQPSKEQWKSLEDSMKAHVGVGNAHKSAAFSFPEPDVKVQLEKLDIEGTDQGARFATITDSLSLKIVSAHQVPPMLAGIQIPGKLAANNELPNAIRVFQLLTVAPAQEIFENRLETTLGNPKKNGRLFGARQQKIEFKAITDVLDLLAMQALAGQKTPGAALATDMGAPASAGGAAAPNPQQVEQQSADTAFGRKIGQSLV